MSNVFHEWTAESIQRLTRLWEAGDLSASEIGEVMGISKNAVIGKVRRLGLSGRPNPVNIGRAPRAEPAKRQRGASLPALVSLGGMDAVEPAATAAPVAPPSLIPFPAAVVVPVVVAPAFRRQCEWLEGSAPPFVRCDASAVAGKSWCRGHYDRVFVRRPRAAEFVREA